MIEEILAHAKETFPKECCGLVVLFKGRERYVRCNNISDDQNEEFVIDPRSYLAAEQMGDIIKVVHSHPRTAPTPSEADKVCIEKSNLPWIIINPVTCHWTETKPSGYKADLIGRKYAYGVLDCYTLIVDYYAELGIKLNDYPRKGTLAGDAENYLENLTKEGFVKVDTPQEHDMVLMCLEHNKPNHGAIYVGNNKILQHCENRLSSRDVYGGFWLRNTYGYYRHLDLLNKI